MKKLCALFAAVMTVATILFLTSCSADAMENVSERRSGYFTASDGFAAVTVVSGVREQPYAADGRTDALKPYTLITFVPTTFDVDAIISYKAATENGTFGGALIVHPFAASFSAEFDSETTAAFTLSFTVGGETHEYEPTSAVTDDMMTFDRAVDAAKTELKPSEPYEIRVQLVKDPIDGDGICWYVSFIYGENDMCGVLLDPITAKVIAKKN